MCLDYLMLKKEGSEVCEEGVRKEEEEGGGGGKDDGEKGRQKRGREPNVPSFGH